MLVNCVAYEHGQKVSDIPVEEISDYIKREGCFVWVALKDPEPAELDDMQREFDLPDLVVEDARHGHQRPKIEEYGPSLFVVLHMLEPRADELVSGEVGIFVGENYVLSIRRGVERGFADVRARTEAEPQLLQHGAVYVLYALMDAVVDRYFPLLDAVSTEIETIEEHIFAGQTTRATIEALYDSKRDLMTLKHATGPLMDATARLFGGRVPALCAPLQDYFRDIYDHLVRINQAIDNLRDNMTTVISVNLSLIQLQENEVTKRLAAYAALIAVPTLIVGVYGMNFRFMPELTWKWGYPLIVGVMVVIDVVLFAKFRKAKWL